MLFLLGGCKHALAFLMWVHRRTEDPSPTDVTSYWVRPRLSAVGTSKKFIAAADFGASSFSPADSSRSGTSFMEEVLNVGLRENLEGQIMQYTPEYQDNLDKLAIYKLLCHFCAEGGLSVEDFLAFSSEQMTPDICKHAEKLTQGQADSPLWHEFRFGRITASKLHEFAHCKSPEGSLVETIIGAYKVRDTKHMKRGRLLEKEVLRTVEKQLQLKFYKCGFFMLPTYPMFGASPDAITAEFVVEVKCPATDKTFKNYIREGEVTSRFKAQVHLQMFCAQKKKGIVLCSCAKL